jgi:SAM-dependent methyltransferase
VAAFSVTCKLCGSDDLRLFYRQGNRRQYAFYRCPQCLLVTYDTRHGVSQAKYVMRNVDPDRATRQNRAHRQTYEFIMRHARPPGRLLDLGCGDGTILVWARRDGWDVRGVELFPEQTALLRERLQLPVETADIASYAGTPASAEVVVLTHVLEHLPDPVAALRKIRELLVPGGVAVLEFPNIDGLDQRARRLLERLHLHRRHYAETYVPGHVQEFCRSSFEFACGRAGLSLERWETYAVNRVKYLLYRALPLGNKARVLVRRPSHER